MNSFARFQKLRNSLEQIQKYVGALWTADIAVACFPGLVDPAFMSPQLRRAGAPPWWRAQSRHYCSTTAISHNTEGGNAPQTQCFTPPQFISSSILIMCLIQCPCVSHQFASGHDNVMLYSNVNMYINAILYYIMRYFRLYCNWNSFFLIAVLNFGLVNLIALRQSV